MKAEFKQTGFAFVVLYAIALILAMLGRMGLAVLDGMGGITYDYIAASTGPILAQMLTVFTGVQLYGFMCAMGLMCATFVTGNMILGVNYSRNREKAGRFSTAFLWGLVTTVVAMISFVVVAGGLLSTVQMASMKTKLEIDGGMILMGILAVLTIATLFASAAAVICACVARSGSQRALGLKLIIAAAGWGLVVVLLSVFTFNTVNAATLDGMSGALWFGIDTVVNVGMALAAGAFMKKAAVQLDI